MIFHPMIYTILKSFYEVMLKGQVKFRIKHTQNLDVLIFEGKIYNNVK